MRTTTPPATAVSAPRQAPPPAEADRRAIRRARLTPYLFLAPALLVYAAFLVYPMLSSLVTSTTDWDGLSPDRAFVGLGNYLRVFQDPISLLALGNNLIWTAATVVVPTVFGLALAVALDTGIRGRTVLRSIFYAPGVLPLTGVALIWGWMYNPNFGFINEFLRAVGLDGLAHGWLGDSDTALGATIVAGVWVRTGIPMLLYLAGLQGIPRELHEAARIDGAGHWQVFRNVTLPGLRETHVIVIALAAIEAVKVFDLVYAMTYGGPARSTQVLGTWMYFNTFQYHHAGFGSALAWVISGLSILVAVPYLVIMRRRGA